MSTLTNKQKIIRDILIYCARRRSTITYDELGEHIGRTARGPWTTDLGAIRKKEMESGRPDLSWVVVSKVTDLPRIYMGETLDPKDERRVERYRRDLEGVYAYWGMIGCGGKGLSKSVKREDLIDFACEDDRRLRMTTISRQEREDQDFIDAISDWDWDDR